MPYIYPIGLSENHITVFIWRGTYLIPVPSKAVVNINVIRNALTTELVTSGKSHRY